MKSCFYQMIHEAKLQLPDLDIPRSTSWRKSVPIYFLHLEWNAITFYISQFLFTISLCMEQTFNYVIYSDIKIYLNIYHISDDDFYHTTQFTILDLCLVLL